MLRGHRRAGCPAQQATQITIPVRLDGNAGRSLDWSFRVRHWLTLCSLFPPLARLLASQRCDVDAVLAANAEAAALRPADVADNTDAAAMNFDECTPCKGDGHSCP